MKWLGRWTGTSHALAWNYSAGGQIWRLFPSADGPLVIEERDTARKEVLFTCLDAQSGAPLWSNAQFRDRWWMSIETVYDHVLFLHEYATPDMPDHRKIFALDLRDGNVLWSNDDMRYLFSHDRAVYAAKEANDRRRFYELDLQTGTQLREVEDDYLEVLRSTLAPRAGDDIFFPRPYPGSEEEEIADIIHAHSKNRPGIHSIETIDHTGGLIVGTYERLAPEDPGSILRHRLAVLDKSTSKALYEDTMDTDMKVGVPDLFFCRGAMLYYIRQKSTLCALHLMAE